ncbi:nuclear pore complex protein Nup98-Nup96 isoform X2 [Apis mellifera caucasica]|nr:nuclear pore complex protein Nup98-Nup96 isoform X2 [Apis mellifera caucasica]
MFGQSGSTSFSGFNTATQSSPFGQSAFGKPITTTSFGTGAAPVFGSSNTSLFSSKPASSTTGGLFGNTTTPPAFTQPSFGGFGTTNTNTNLFGTQQNASTNLFGTSTATSAFGQSNKPAGFGFGATSGTNLFGQPQQSTQQTTPFGQSSTTGNTNLFGTTPGFGNTNTTTTSMTGTVVKFTPVITTDSMSKNGISHTISARHWCIASMKEYESKSYEELRFEDYSVGRKGPGTGIFGTPAQPSPFGNAGAGFGGMSGGFGATTQSGSSGLFGKPITSFGTPATTTTNNFAFNSTPSTNLFGSNTQKPFGTAAPTPLFAASNTNQNAGTGFGINTGQNTTFGPTFGSTQSNQSIGLFNQNKSAFNAPSTSSSAAFSNFGQTPSSNTGTSLFGAKSTGTIGFGTTSSFGSTTPSTFGTTTGFTAGQNSGASLFNTPFKPTGQTPGFSFGSTSTPSSGLAKVTLTRVGYYTIPSLDELHEYVDGEKCIVPNFTVGREGYGNVYFPESFDIYGLNLDDIVHFRRKEVIIYPDDEKKPAIGQGLNRKAQVTLDQVWPHDKSLHKDITDPCRLLAMGYEEKLRRVSAKHDTKFLEYRPETGSWVFKVDHFSKYGLSDSDEDDNNVPTVNDTKRLKLCTTTQQKCATKLEQSKALDVDHNQEKRLPISPTGDSARILGTDSHKLQLMKASFFDGSDEEIYDQESNRRLFLSSGHKTLRSFINSVQKIDEDQKYESNYNSMLRSNLTIHHTPTISYEEPTLSKLGIQMGRMFKPSWGRGLTLLTLNTRKQADEVPLNSPFEEIGSYVCGRSPEDTSSIAIVQRIQILGGNRTDDDRVKIFKESIEGHLKIQLSHRVMNQEGDCPIFDVDTDVNKASMALHAHCSLAEEFAEQFSTDCFASYVANVWKLCVALWGTLPDINVASEAHGLWHWAIFVMLHLKDAGKRKTAVMNLLQRHVEIDEIADSVDPIEREKFLREELENYDYLRDLLRPLIPPEYSSTISGWTYQGQLLWEYMEITMDVESLLRGADPRGISSKLESLKQRLSSLPSKINQFPCPTAKHRLCQAEIAKRTLHLARSLLQSNENRSTSIFQLVSQLPLPEDYAQQELRPIVNMRVNEIIYQAA